MSGSASLIEKLSASLKPVDGARILVAYSGGIDSTVLLHAAATRCGFDLDRLVAVHIDHNLHHASQLWSDRCMATAAALGVHSIGLRIENSRPAGESIEAWARDQRYELLRSLIRPGDVLATAHHADDLTETFFLHLLRGAGPHGLAGIPQLQVFGCGTLVRPLLDVRRVAIVDYAREHGLEWIEDPSNVQDVHDRNYLRHHVLPRIKSRWPAMLERVAGAVELQRDAAAALDTMIDSILVTETDPRKTSLRIAPLLAQDERIQRWALRRWIKLAGYPLPDSVHLRAMQAILHARPDAEPQVRWKGAELRRYRGALFLTRVRPGYELGGRYPWRIEDKLSLPHGRLTAAAVNGAGIRATALEGATLSVRFRQGGERCHPSGRPHSQTLKRLFQEWAVPPWQRGNLPLIYVNEELAAVADICVSRPFAAGSGEAGWVINWRCDETASDAD